MKRQAAKKSGARRSRKAATANPPSYASVWKEELANTKPRERLSIQKVIAGLPCRVKRMTPMDYWRAGELPAYLSNVVVESLNGLDAETMSDTDTELTDAERAQQMAFMRHLTLTSVEEPKIVPNNNPASDEISYAQLFLAKPQFVWELYGWFMAGCPDAPIMTTEGPTTLESVENFR